MHLQLRDQQLKAILCVYIDFYIKTSWLSQTKKSVIDSHTNNKSNSNTTLKIVIKPQKKRTKGKKKGQEIIKARENQQK